MKALCTTPDNTLVLRDIPEPADIPPSHVLVRIMACAINHGDKTFLRNRAAAGAARPDRRHDVWGASAAGRVIATGANVPALYEGRQVALYRSLGNTPETIGLWCEQALVPITSCLLLPEDVDPTDYSGSLVNIITAWAYLEQIRAEGRCRAILATAPGSATGTALSTLAAAFDIDVIALPREPDPQTLASLASHGPAAVFDGVGGAALSRIVPHLPLASSIDIYGFLDGQTPLTLSTTTIMARDLTIRRFSNFESQTVRDPQRLNAALHALEAHAGNPQLRTRIGQIFPFSEIDAAMAYEQTPGRKAVLVP